MTTALIFDCYGVLTTDAWLPFKTRHFGHDTALFSQATDLNKQANAGMLGHADFLRAIAELADVTTDDVRYAIENNIPNTLLFEAIARLKKNYKIGMLSNAGDNWLADLFETEQLELFDATALSYETGHIKPDVMAYEVIAERLGVSTGECVFVDDQERFCGAARDAGMRAIWYRSFEQFETDIAALDVA